MNLNNHQEESDTKEPIKKRRVRATNAPSAKNETSSTEELPSVALSADAATRHANLSAPETVDPDFATPSLVDANATTSPEAQAEFQKQVEAWEKTARDEYGRYTSHLWSQRRDSESDADKLVLTLASAILAVSAGILKNVVPIDQAILLPILFGSWGCFGAAITSTLVSYYVSRKSIDEHIDASKSFFFDGNENAFDEVNKNKRNTEWLNKTSAATFVLGLILTFSFLGANVQNIKTMSDKNSKSVRLIEPRNPKETTIPFGETPPPPPALPSKPTAKPMSTSKPNGDSR